MFKPNALFYVDGYKTAHKKMLALGTTRLYGTWIPRSLKYAPKGIKKLVSMGQQLTCKWIDDEFKENFFNLPKGQAMKFAKDMSLYLGMEYDGKHFEELWQLRYLPIEVQSLPEGIETLPNIPHMTFINTVDGFAWLPLYLETIISALSWKCPTSATLALQYKRVATEWVMKTDPAQDFLIPFLCHDFSARGTDPFTMLSSGLGHASSFRGSDSLIVIPGARYFYGEPENEVCINSVNASEHSVSTTKIFTCGEKQMIIDWLKEFPTGILSIVADTFDLWKLIVEYLQDEEVKALILARDGKLVIRPDSGDPVDIICGVEYDKDMDFKTKDGLLNKTKFEGLNKKVYREVSINEQKGVIELLWDIFGGTVNTQGYKVLDPHIGAIYGDSINLDRQLAIYERLADKGFAATNIVLGVGSFTYQFNTRDTLGFAAKGAWFEVKEQVPLDVEMVVQDSTLRKSYNIYKDPVTDDGTKKSLKGFQFVSVQDGEYVTEGEVSEEKAYSVDNILRTIYKNGVFLNQTTLTEIRTKLN